MLPAEVPTRHAGLQVDNQGGYINFADSTVFPASTTMLGAVVKFAPGGLRQLHWHTTLSEWQFVINGTYEVYHCGLPHARPCMQAPPSRVG